MNEWIPIGMPLCISVLFSVGWSIIFLFFSHRRRHRRHARRHHHHHHLLYHNITNLRFIQQNNIATVAIPMHTSFISIITGK